MDLEQNLQRALVAQQAGRLDEAARLYRDILAVEPVHFFALHALGLVEFQRGDKEQGVFHIRESLRLQPGWAEAWYNLGNALQTLGELEASAESYRRALELKPDFAEAFNNLGNVLHGLGRQNEAIAAYGQALALKPDYAEAHNNLGNLWQALGKLNEAVACYRRTLELNPSLTEAHNNLGNSLQALGKPDEALLSYRRAVELGPYVAEAHYNLGNALQAQGRFDEAASSYRRALELRRDYAEAHNNLGNVLQLQGKLEEAVVFYGRSIELKPDFAEAHSNLATLLLMEGNFESGWPEFEWRWKTKRLTERSFSESRWDGGPLDTRTILIHTEQGLGDTIQFIRYAGLVKERNPRAKVIVECQRQLVPLLGWCPGIDQLIGKGDGLPKFDLHLPLLSLPRVLKTSVETIPAGVPYLFADQALVAQWRRQLARSSGPRIGIHWKVNTIAERQNRNIPVDFIAALAQQFPEISLVSLQKEATAAELARISERVPVVDAGPDLDTANGAFMDTAAIMMNLDLVISSDTSVAHLAGALGVPVWLALPHVADWRWLLNRDDSPWYPTMRLFSQPAPDEWSQVFEEIQGALREMIRI